MSMCGGAGQIRLYLSTSGVLLAETQRRTVLTGNDPKTRS